MTTTATILAQAIFREGAKMVAAGHNPMELEALSNTLVEGSTFTARAHRLTYAEEKDLLVLEGDGRTDAQLFRQPRREQAFVQVLMRPRLHQKALLEELLEVHPQLRGPPR